MNTINEKRNVKKKHRYLRKRSGKLYKHCIVENHPDLMEYP